MNALLTAIEHVTDSITIESVTNSITIQSIILSVVSEDAWEVHPSRGEFIHPRTNGPRGSLCPRTGGPGVQPSSDTGLNQIVGIRRRTFVYSCIIKLTACLNVTSDNHMTMGVVIKSGGVLHVFPL